jgi:long-chain fatty acid transport protein
MAIGASIDIQYAEASLTQAVDFGTICVGQYGLAACDSIGLQPQQDDGTQRLRGTSWSYGISLGLAYEISPSTRLGAVYHGAVSQTLEGKSEFENVPAIPEFEQLFTDSDGRLKVHMPETISFSLAHAVTGRFRLLADYTWTGWGRYNELRVEFDNGLDDAVSKERLNDTSRYAIGAHYRWTPTLLLRAGFAYDETPVPDAEHRSPRVPDADRRWYTVGTGWTPSADFSMDFAYGYVSAKDIPINNTDDFGHRLTGTFDASGDFLSAQANWKF